MASMIFANAMTVQKLAVQQRLAQRKVPGRDDRHYALNAAQRPAQSRLQVNHQYVSSAVFQNL